jgi:hypothetical protein
MFRKFGSNARSMNEGRNKITKMAGSERSTSTCKYKRHNAVMGRLCHEPEQCSTVPTTKEASQPICYLQTRAVDE